MTIIINGILEAEETKKKLKPYKIVSLLDPGENCWITKGFDIPIIYPDRYYRNPNHLVCEFYDLNDEVGPYKQIPSKFYIEEILKFTEDYSYYGDQTLLVHCHAGVSRSSATAIIIAMASVSKQQMMPTIPILTIETQLDHIMNNFYDERKGIWPNQRILEIGEELLGFKNQEIVNYIVQWKKDKLELYKKDYGQSRHPAFAKQIEVNKAAPYRGNMNEDDRL